MGVGTLRVLRELYRVDGTASSPLTAWRAWMRTGVSVQGAATALERVRRAGLAQATAPAPGHAPTYRLRPDHPWYIPLAHLFAAERRRPPTDR